MSNASGMNLEAIGPIHCFPEGLLGMFDSPCFASFCKVFVAAISIACPVCFLEVDVGSPRPINRGQFGVDGGEDRQMMLASLVEIDQSDSSAMSLEAKLTSGEVDQSFVGSLVVSFSLGMV